MSLFVSDDLSLVKASHSLFLLAFVDTPLVECKTLDFLLESLEVEKWLHKQVKDTQGSTNNAWSKILPPFEGLYLYHLFGTFQVPS